MIRTLATWAIGWRALALAGGLAFLAGAGAGWKVRDAFCDAAAARRAAAIARAEAQALRGQLETQKEIAGRVAAQRDALAAHADELDQKVADYEAQLTIIDVALDQARAACVDPDAARRLRQLR